MGSAADSPSYEASKYGQGLLTYALLQGMHGASLDDGSRLSVTRWFGDASEEVPDLAQSIGGIQKPIVAAPRGRGFPIGLLTLEDRMKIPHEPPKPEVLRLECEDEVGLDPLRLRSLLREELRALNYVQDRGTGRASPIIYLDAVDDDLPGAIIPKIRYRILGNTISVQIRLISDEKIVSEDTIETANGGAQRIAGVLKDKILSMVAAIQWQK